MDFSRAEWFALLAVMIAGATFALNAGLQLWGGGTGFQLRFTKLKESYQEDISKAKQDYTNIFVGLRERIHSLEIDHLKFAKHVAEHYIRSPEFHAEAGEIKADMQRGFEKVDKQFDRILDTIENNRRADNRAH